MAHFEIHYNRVKVSHGNVNDEPHVRRDSLDGGRFECDAANQAAATRALTEKVGGKDIEVTVTSISQS